MSDTNLRPKITRTPELLVVGQFSTRAIQEILREGTSPFSAPRDSGDLLKVMYETGHRLSSYLGAPTWVSTGSVGKREHFRTAFDIERR